MTYYNEWNQYCAEWLRNLFPDADVDDRDIRDVGVGDVASYDRVHLFAGVGGWEYALHLAGWPDTEQVWSGSCPCQSFSRAGKKRGMNDERHLWPEMFRLIDGVRPKRVFGEQVAGQLGLEWFNRVRTNLEGIGYEVGMVALPACCVGSPQWRERIFWVANTYSVELHDAIGQATAETAGRGDNAKHSEWRGASEPQRAGAVAPWASYQSVFCTDEKLRRIEPGVCPLAPRLPGDVERLRTYGNVVIPQVAAVFIRSYMQVKGIIPQPQL